MSILDGRRRLRGGRKLAISALVLIAGLVPALAAIEPWDEERELGSSSQAVTPAGSVSQADTAGLARVLGELEALEREMEPFEAELESIEVEMEPFEAELENFEVEMGPIERAAMALGRRQEEVTPQLMRLLDAKDLQARYGACQALKMQRKRGADAVPALLKTLRADDLWLRILAAEALAGNDSHLWRSLCDSFND